MGWSLEAETTHSSAPLRLVVVAGLRLCRQLIVEVFAAQHSFVVEGQAATADEAFALVQATSPCIVILDATMPGALALAGRIAASAPRTQIVAFGVGDRDDDVLACAEAGIDGYVTKGASVDDLMAAVDATVRGELQCSPRIVARLFRRVASLARGDEPRSDRYLLTAREREIALLIEQGLSNKEIAVRLHIEVATVKNHVHHVLGKLGVGSRVEALASGRLRADGVPITTDEALHDKTN